ncbi:HAD family hydrolase [Rhodobacter capsulatus]|uniref:HAD family hydrolase n=1 Tax=Rhodobacter capsulatus TaxID=1061 RepID=UPI0003D3A398|nr:HAD family phosphatase [Rhodobacter capsulatus]ETD87708.1 haloacid dehalogenase [Rhodobacter capsulatus YW2]
MDQPLRAILWDMDGTLLDSEPVHRLSFVDAARACGLTLPAEFHEGLIGKSEDAIHAILAAEHGLTLSLAHWSELRFAAYLARIEEVHPFRIATDLWARAQAAGLSQAIVSNSPEGIVRANLTRLGLAPGAVRTVSRHDVRRGKPDPEPYLLALARLGLPPEAVAVVEDSAAGLAAARAAGLCVYMMPWFEGPAGDWQPFAALSSRLPG